MRYSEEDEDTGLYKQVAESFEGTLEGEDLTDICQIIISYSGYYCNMFSVSDFMTELDLIAETGVMIAHFTEQFPGEDRHAMPDPLNLEWIDGSGNISCLVSPELKELVKDWIQDGERYYAPRTTGDLLQEEFLWTIDALRQRCAETQVALSAFPAEVEWERKQEEGSGAIDDVFGDEDQGTPDAIRQAAEERSMLEEIPLPGTPVNEAERLRLWLQIPRAARAAIRRLYAAFGYPVKGVLVEICGMQKQHHNS